jgi:hypothetical protein
VRRILGEEPTAQPRTDSQPSDRVLERIEVPRAVADWKQNPQQRKLAEQLQSSNRTALQEAFARGLAVTGYERTTVGDGCFLLGPATEIPTE